jgi:hypothetical protein
LSALPPGADHPGNAPDSHRQSLIFGLAASAIVLLAAALRIRGAIGPLWVDEVWSLDIVANVESGATSFAEALTFDNNHYLNTLYLALVGIDAPVLLQRGLSILLGVAAVIAAGLGMRRYGRPAMLAAMGLFAVSFPLVNFGSEARGYAGLVLMTLLALLVTERAMDSRRRGWPLLLGLVALLGLLFQPIMAMSLVLLAVWCAAAAWRETRSLRHAEATGTRVFLPAIAFCAVLIAGFAIVMHQAGGYQIAGRTPFTVENFLSGFGTLTRLLLGIWGPPNWTGTAAAVLIALGALAIGSVRRDRRAMLYLLALIVLPLAIVAARPPNVEFPRYYLATGSVLLLCLAHLFAVAWRHGGVWRVIATVLSAALLFGDTVELGAFFASGRGDVLPALDEIASSPRPVVTSNSGMRDQTMIDHVAAKYGVHVTYVTTDELCAARPRWLLTSDPRDIPEDVQVSRPGCTIEFHRERVYPFWGLSGARWTLYRAK